MTTVNLKPYGGPPTPADYFKRIKQELAKGTEKTNAPVSTQQVYAQDKKNNLIGSMVDIKA